MGKKKKKGKAGCQHTGPREDEWEAAPTPRFVGKYTEFIRSLRDRSFTDWDEDINNEQRIWDELGLGLGREAPAAEADEHYGGDLNAPAAEADEHYGGDYAPAAEADEHYGGDLNAPAAEADEH